MASITNDDLDLIVMLSAAGGAGCTLAKTPQKDNWVDKAGHLPPYICAIARAVARGGKPVSSAIAIAVSRAKAWASGRGKVDADTRAKAAAAVAQWEALKAKSHAGKLVKATAAMDGELRDYIMLSNVSFNIDNVRQAWDAKDRIRRQALAKEKLGDNYDPMRVETVSDYGYQWVKEVWSDFIIVTCDGPEGPELLKIPYTVGGDGDDFTFGDPIEVEQVYQEKAQPELTDHEKELLGLTEEDDALTVKLSAYAPQPTPLEKVLAAYRARS